MKPEGAVRARSIQWRTACLVLAGILVGSFLISPVTAHHSSSHTAGQIAALKKLVKKTRADLKRAKLVLADRCVAGTTLRAGMCVEEAARPAATWYIASKVCALVDGRLPTPSELWGLMESGVDLVGDQAFGEGTAGLIYGDDTNFTGYWTVRDDGSHWVRPATEANPYRCVSTPTNTIPPQII